MVDREIRKRKHLQICADCGAYMNLDSPVSGETVGKVWQHESQHRSFGGVQIRRFVCENKKCNRVDTFQVDDLAGLKEDP